MRDKFRKGDDVTVGAEMSYKEDDIYSVMGGTW